MNKSYSDKTALYHRPGGTPTHWKTDHDLHNAVDKSKRPISKLVSEKTKNFSFWLTINFEIGPLSCPPECRSNFKVSYTEKFLAFSDTNFEICLFDLSTAIILLKLFFHRQKMWGGLSKPFSKISSKTTKIMISFTSKIMFAWSQIWSWNASKPCMIFQEPGWSAFYTFLKREDRELNKWADVVGMRIQITLQTLF